MPRPKQGGRKPSDQGKGKVEPTLPAATLKCLETLAKMGTYGGDNKTEVARYLITRMIDDLIRAGVLKPPTAD